MEIDTHRPIGLYRNRWFRIRNRELDRDPGDSQQSPSANGLFAWHPPQISHTCRCSRHALQQAYH